MVVEYRARDGFVSSLHGIGCIVPSRPGPHFLEVPRLHLCPPAGFALTRITSLQATSTREAAYLFLPPNPTSASSADDRV